MGKIFFKTLSFLFFYVVYSADQQQQRNVPKLKHQVLSIQMGPIAKGQAHSQLKKPFNKCENISNCGNEIGNAVAAESQILLQVPNKTIELQVCYPSIFASANLATNVLQDQGKFKLSRQYKLSKKRGHFIFCNDIKQKGKAIWMDVRLKMIRSRIQVKLESSFFDGVIDMSDVKLNGIPIFNYAYQDFVKELFQGNSSCTMKENKYSNDPMANEFGKFAKDGAFLNDFNPFWVIAMDLLASIAYLNKTKQNLAIYYLATVEDGLTDEEIKELQGECKKNLTEWNTIAGYKKFAYNAEMCLISNEEFIRTKMGVKLSEHSEKALRESQEYGGLADGPLVPAPLESLEEEKKKATSSRIEVNPADYGFENTNVRIKKQAVGAKVPPKTYTNCYLYQTAIAEKWKYCEEIINYIAEQDICESAYAIVPASVLTDRACILLLKKRQFTAQPPGLGPFAFDFNFNPILGKIDILRRASARDAMECSIDGGKGEGCTDGNITKVWEYYTSEGTVNEICKPFVNRGARPDWGQRCFASCDSDADDNGSLDLMQWGNDFDKNSYHQEIDYNTWKNAKIFASTLYKVSFYRDLFGTQNWEQTMENELISNGSIVAVMKVYDDFRLHNPDHIYRHNNTAAFLKFHAVRLIGFGHVDCETFHPFDGGKKTISTQKYWLAANSWGNKVHKKGIFRIARGVDECGIESLSVSWGDVHFPFDGGK